MNSQGFKALRAENLKKIYGNKEVVKSVSLDIKRGEVVGLLGPNGAGKTTSFYMITGMIRPTQGKIYFDDQDITGMAMYKRARMGMGYLNITHKGATMRLGSYNCELNKDTLIYKSYKERKIKERHRHRYEFNNKYLKQMQNKDLVIGGVNKKLNLVETIELKNHPWFIGVQFHPELKSRVMKTHPLFNSFIKSAIKYSNALK